MSKNLHRILVVDDDQDIGTMIKMMLEYHGYCVVVLEKADDLETILSRGNFNLLIMDMLLSGTNGIDICTQLKQDKLFLSIPIIMISAHPNAKEISLKAGADDFVGKPFDMEEMLSKVSRLVSA